MKTRQFFVGGLFAVVFALIFAACGGDPGDTGGGLGGDSDLSGNITISPSAGISIGTELTAAYSGNESVSFQWKKDTTSVGTDTTYTPTTVGSYTVTVSATGYKSKTSDAVTVLSGSGTQEDPFQLAEDTWTDGIITSTKTEAWYSFDVTGGANYYVWWNEAGSGFGNGLKTLNVKVSGYYNDEASPVPNFTDEITAWIAPRHCAPSEDGTVLLKVAPNLTGGTGTFGIVYSTTSSKPNLPFSPPSPIPLTANQWKDGVITSATSEVWYSFNVVSGTTYYVWWNDGYESNSGGSSSGNGIKTLDVEVSAYYSNSTWETISGFSEVDNGWSLKKSFTPTANLTVYLKVKPFSAGGTGTFGIVYSTGTDMPALSFTPPSPIPLTANQWRDGEIAAASNGAAWYSFPVTAGTTTSPSIYKVWVNELSPNGNGMKTLDVRVRGFYSDGTSAFSTTANAWSSGALFTATKSGTVYLKVTPNTSGNIGTFGITYNTGLNATRPAVTFNPSTTALAADVWEDGEITGLEPAWYSLTVTGGNTYYFWWNDGYDSISGNRNKTLDISVSAYDGEGGAISGFANVDYAWSTAKSFAPDTDGTVYIRVTPYYTGYTGTFGIVYSETNARPDIVIIPPVTPIPLTADVWEDGEITSSGGEAWYSFEVTTGTTYRVWCNDNTRGSDGKPKSLDVSVSIWNTNGNNVSYLADLGESSSQSITPNSDGTVYVRVVSRLSGGGTPRIGTFGIIYSATATTRPPVYLDIPNTIPLVEDQAANGEITSPGGEAWYSFDVTAGTTYRLWYNGGSNNGDGTKTLPYERAVVYYRNNTTAFTWDTGLGWDRAASFTPTEGQAGKAYVRVYSDSTSGTGTFSVIYSTDSTKPLVPIVPPNVTPLTADQWADGQLTSSSGGAAWYSFTIQSATNHYLWWNDAATGGTSGNGLKTLDVKVSAFYADGTSLFTDVDTGWSSPQSITSVDAGRIGTVVYVRVRPYFSSGTGTFGIVYSATNTRPVAPFEPPNPTVLTAAQWADGNLASDGQEWFRFTATAATQYIHFSFGSLSSLYVQLYDSTGASVEGETNLGTIVRSISRSLTVGQTYYIKVRPSSSSGNYQIVFNDSSTVPPIALPQSFTVLTAAQWVDGNIPTSGGQEWFKFNATAATQYIHFSSVGTLGDLRIQIYNSSGVTVGDAATLYSSTSARYFSRSLTIDQPYYIKVWPNSGSGKGTYQIAFNASATPPVFPATELTANQWADGDIPTSGGQEWFVFTATAATQYIHVSFGTLTSLSVQLYEADGATTVGSSTSLSVGSSPLYISRSVTQAQTYRIRVRPYSTYTGNYKIAFNASTTVPPIALPSNSTELTAAQWANGDLTSDRQEWFRFTATAATQYIHVSFGTLEYLSVLLYDNGGSEVDVESNLSGGTRYISRTVTVGNVYYIRVRPSYSDANGTYRIAFNTSTSVPVGIPPNPTVLAAGTWADGDIPTSNGEEWFKFTATAATQYIHFSTTGTLRDVWMQLYDNGGGTVGAETNMYSTTRYTSRTVTAGDTYYIRVRPYGGGASGGVSGNYRIAFSNSSAAPAQ